ncbi:hypothetical protein CXG45_25710 [Pseudomonas plecoglossicida]|uniref:Uncharacterized protein n=1 Tax=Pseudomonas plecoglossicida TaxID=70775 RepID=A0ABX4TU65_PSEDL|nr:hypothetical protein CXG44_24260 [Pseudomonas plecoglossicida]PLU89885.1 hypothetical protein CXG45_25710 [Pseudomonas plecoglossicida]PLU98916.1 hypothetical protein CXG48_25105 [Pseudomonas plecoglossicida]PLV08359.1 hypothetical protein CXG47_26200 [Pseudomonas plecoglossicida]
MPIWRNWPAAEFNLPGPYRRQASSHIDSTCGRLPSPFDLRCRAENKYRSFEASFVGAALCCEEAGTDKACLWLVPASSQHKAAPTEPR